MLADELDYVLGVDTHRDEHVLAVVTAPAGAPVAGTAAPANAGGYRELIRVAGRYIEPRRRTRGRRRCRTTEVGVTGQHFLRRPTLSARHVIGAGISSVPPARIELVRAV